MTGGAEVWRVGSGGADKGVKPQRAHGEGRWTCGKWEEEVKRSRTVRVFVLCAQDEELLGPASV